MPSAHVFDTACVCAAGRTAGCVTCKISRAAGCAAGSSVIFDAQLAALLAAASSREITFAVDFFPLNLRCFSGGESIFLENMQ